MHLYRESANVHSMDEFHIETNTPTSDSETLELPHLADLSRPAHTRLSLQ